MASIIETGVDKLIELVKKHGKISFRDAATELGVSLNILEEWADFLEEEGLINIQYKLTTPYLVERKLTKKEAVDKAKDFFERKDTFISKAESMLSVIEMESKELQQIKGDADQLRKGIGGDITKVKGELQELEKYEQIKDDLHKKIFDVEQEFKTKLDGLNSQILYEQKKYDELLHSVEEEETRIEKQRHDSKTLEEKEELLLARLMELESTIGKLKDEIKDEYRGIISSEKHTKELKRFAENIKRDVADKKARLFGLLGEREKRAKKIASLQEEISKKLEATAKNVSSARHTSKKFHEFLDKRMQISEMIDKLNREREELRNELSELIKKARLFRLSPKSEDLSKEIEELENKFNDIDKKKNIFEIELRKFMQLFK